MALPAESAFKFFEFLAEKQEKIFPDQEVYGITLDKFPIAEARVQLKDLLNYYRAPQFQYESQKWETGKLVAFFIPIDNTEDVQYGYFFCATFNEDKNASGGGYVTIDIDQTSRPRKK